MSLALTLGTLLLVSLCVFGTRRYALDNRAGPPPHNRLRDFWRDIAGVLTDRYALYVFVFFGIVCLGTAVVSQVQMFTYVDFMKFTHTEKTIVHGSGMIACALGSLLQTYLVVRFDKKQAGYIGTAVSMAGNTALMVLFIGGILPPQQTWTAPAAWPWLGGASIPVSMLAFALFQSLWWAGVGVLVPLTTSMIADVSGIHFKRTGVLKDGSYSAIFSFVTKFAAGIGLFVNGWALDWAGFVSGNIHQSPEALRHIAILTFLSGPIVLLLALPILWNYPVDRAFMKQLNST